MSSTDPPFRRFVPRRTGDASPLGHLELAVMEVIWTARDSASVGDVHERLPGEPQIAYNTVKTTMERLAEKGILRRAKAGKAYRYDAAVTRDELERRIVTGVLDRLVEEFPAAVASFFVRPDGGISEQQMALLLEAIERHEEGGDAG